jgi:uncharacterized protein (DUF433 family)
MDDRFDVPLYTIREAASHLAMPHQTLATWVAKDGLVRSLEEPARNGPRLPFIALAEAQLYRELRKAGLSMQAITAGMRRVRRVLGRDMLREGALASDGVDILMKLDDADGGRDWVRARDEQGSLKGVVEIGLSPITWAADGYPQVVRLTAYPGIAVVADPQRAFGQPIVKGTRARVIDIVSLFKAGESVATVAEEMDVPTAAVESIVRVHVQAIAA